MVKVLRDEVVELCESLGFATAGKWDKAKTQKKLVDVAELAEAGEVEVEDERLAKLLAVIVDAKGAVEVVKELPEEETVEEEPDADEEETDEDEPGYEGELPDEDEAPEEELAPKAKKERKSKAPNNEGTKKFSLIKAAIMVMEKSGEPMKLGEVLDGITSQGLWSPPKAGKTPAASLNAQICTEIKKKGSDSRFVRVDRGIFKLA